MSESAHSDIGMILTKNRTKYSIIGSQLFDNQYIWGYRHLFSAAWHALNARKNNRMISKTISIEVLLYVAAQRQIKKAIALLGVKKTTKDVAGILLGEASQQLINASYQLQEELHMKPNINLLDDFSSKNELFIEVLSNDGYNATDFTFNEIEKTVLQKIALLALE
ncbi:MAG: KEOPS complex subunit Cgi121 [Candidatus Hodarchaeales archaeon]|jgi:tRNA threonylcarbamoyladenosine modification (KEOPS) complex Cgi121 subunit